MTHMLEGAGPNAYVVVLIPHSLIGPRRATRTNHYHLRSGSSLGIVPHGVLAGMFGRPPRPVVLPSLLSHQATLSKQLRGEISLSFGVAAGNCGTVLASKVFLSAWMGHLPVDFATVQLRLKDEYTLRRDRMPGFSVVTKDGVELAPGGIDELCDVIVTLPVGYSKPVRFAQLPHKLATADLRHPSTSRMGLDAHLSDQQWPGHPSAPAQRAQDAAITAVHARRGDAVRAGCAAVTDAGRDSRELFDCTTGGELVDYCAGVDTMRVNRARPSLGCPDDQPLRARRSETGRTDYDMLPRALSQSPVPCFLGGLGPEAQAVERAFALAFEVVLHKPSPVVTLTVPGRGNLDEIIDETLGERTAAGLARDYVVRRPGLTLHFATQRRPPRYRGPVVAPFATRDQVTRLFASPLTTHLFMAP